MAAAPPEQRFKEVRKTGSVKILPVEGKVHVFMPRRAVKILPVLPVWPKLIIELALFRVFQHLVGFIDFLELFLGLLVAGVEVRVIFAGQPLVGPRNLLGSGRAVHLEELVIIFVGYCHTRHPLRDSYQYTKTCWPVVNMSGSRDAARR